MFQNVKETVFHAYDSLVTSKQKAIAAFLVGSVSTYLARHGLTLNASLAAYLQSVAFGVVTHVVVYTTRNK